MRLIDAERLRAVIAAMYEPLPGICNVNVILTAIDNAPTIEALKATVKQPKTNADRIRHMTDDELVDVLRCICCAFHNMPECGSIDCKEGHMIYLKQEVSEDAGSKTD